MDVLIWRRLNFQTVQSSSSDGFNWCFISEIIFGRNNPVEENLSRIAGNSRDNLWVKNFLGDLCLQHTAKRVFSSQKCMANVFALNTVWRGLSEFNVLCSQCHPSEFPPMLYRKETWSGMKLFRWYHVDQFFLILRCRTSVHSPAPWRHGVIENRCVRHKKYWQRHE